MSVDSTLFSFFYGLSHRVNFLDWLFIFSAKYLAYFIVAAFLIYLILKVEGLRNKLQIFLATSLGTIISRGILTEVIRFFVVRPRPFEVFGIDTLIKHDAASSFPSGHMAFLTPIVLATYYLNRKLGLWLGIGMLIVGLGRVTSGVHFPSDILGGIAVGALSFYIVKFFILRKPSSNL